MSNWQRAIRRQAGYALRQLGVPFVAASRQISGKTAPNADMAARAANTFTFRRTQMAKGQMRSNRELKKPKKDKTKPAVPVLPFGGAQGNSSIPTPIKK